MAGGSGGDGRDKAGCFRTCVSETDAGGWGRGGQLRLQQTLTISILHSHNDWAKMEPITVTLYNFGNRQPNSPPRQSKRTINAHTQDHKRKPHNKPVSRSAHT